MNITTIEEINKKLTDTTYKNLDNIAKQQGFITTQGIICDIKMYDWMTIIVLKHENETLKCVAYKEIHDYIKQNKENLINTLNSVTGNIKVDKYKMWYELNIQQYPITLDNNVVINELIKKCEEIKYLPNNTKKHIKFNKIRHIGIISREDTQGYNDFVTNFKLNNDVVKITLMSISLEGKNTERGLINAIEELNKHDVDVIIIIRGGGCTQDISNSYDTMEIFRTIKQSNIPVITAIGHEADKGDKLLITEISDYNFGTPTKASILMRTEILDDINTNIKNIIRLSKNKYTKIVTDEIDNCYRCIKQCFDIICKNTGYILNNTIFKIDNDTNHVYIKRNNIYYKYTINISDITDDIDEPITNCIYDVYNAIENQDYDKLYTCLDKFYEKSGQIDMLQKSAIITNIVDDISIWKCIYNNLDINIYSKKCEIDYEYCENKVSDLEHHKDICYLYYNCCICSRILDNADDYSDDVISNIAKIFINN